MLNGLNCKPCYHCIKGRKKSRKKENCPCAAFAGHELLCMASCMCHTCTSWHVCAHRGDRDSVWRSRSLFPSHGCCGVQLLAMSSSSLRCFLPPLGAPEKMGFAQEVRSGCVIYGRIICLDMNNLGVCWQRVGEQLPCLLCYCTFPAWEDPVVSPGVFLDWFPSS